MNFPLSVSHSNEFEICARKSARRPDLIKGGSTDWAMLQGQTGARNLLLAEWFYIARKFARRKLNQCFKQSQPHKINS